MTHKKIVILVRNIFIVIWTIAGLFYFADKVKEWNNPEKSKTGNTYECLMALGEALAPLLVLGGAKGIKKILAIIKGEELWEEGDRALPPELRVKKDFILRLKEDYGLRVEAFVEHTRLLCGQQPSALKYAAYSSTTVFKAGKPEGVPQFIPDNFLEEVCSTIIIGKAGSGKTYSFLKRICEGLSAIDLKDEKVLEKLYLPIVLNLSSWKPPLGQHEHETLKLWLRDQIVAHYDFTAKEATDMINDRQIVACLDGLDEVPELHRPDCIKAIAKYRNDGRGVIFSCRKKELLNLLNETQLTMQNTTVYEILPRTIKEIDTIIRHSGNKASVTKMLSFLKHKPEIYDQIETPLLLSLFIKTFDHLSPEKLEELEKAETVVFLNQLWEQYDAQIFSERLQLSSDRSVKLRAYASWIARLIPDTGFYIEQIQPHWLVYQDEVAKIKPKQVRTWLYYLTSRIFSSILLGIGVGCLVASWKSFFGNSILAGAVTALITMWLNRKRTNELSPPIRIVILYAAVLIVVCGGYQGLLVPHESMIGPFARQDCYAGILLGLFYALVFGLRKRQQFYDNDIQPVERFSFNFLSSGKEGLFGGVCIGLVIGGFGVLIQALPNELFKNWLDNYLFLHGIFHGALGTWKAYPYVFLFAFSVAFPVAFLLIAFLSGRDSSQERELVATKKHTLNYGMRRSFEHSLKYGAIAFGLCIVVHNLLFLIFAHRIVDVSKTIHVGMGLGIIVFLWFGGFEIIQHWTLRLYLYLYSIVPIQFGPWLKQMHQVAFIQRSGANLEFQHLTLKAYLRSLPLQADASGLHVRIAYQLKSHYRWPLILVIFSALAYFVYKPLQDKFIRPVYWQRPDVFNVDPGSDSSTIRQLTSTSFLVLKDDTLRLKITGRVEVGTFVGLVDADGTYTSFLGFSIPTQDTTLNKVPLLKHGALLYKKRHEGDWAPAAPMRTAPWPWTERMGFLYVQKNDTLDFCINDREYQNDCGAFKVLFETAAKRKKEE